MFRMKDAIYTNHTKTSKITSLKKARECLTPRHSCVL